VDGEDRHLLTLSIAAVAPVELQVDASQVKVEFGEPEYEAGIVDGPPDMPRGPMLDELLADPLDAATPEIFNLSGLPVPTLLGFQVEGPRGWHQEGHLRFEGELRYTP
jgi:hypothetical protein